MDPRVGGFARVWLDGKQIVNYSGALGGDTTEYYWKTGHYRGGAPETNTVQHRNIHITTG